MIARTTFDQSSGFQVGIDGADFVRGTVLPDEFTFQLSSSKIYYISRSPLDFLCRRRFSLKVSSGEEFASITGGLLGVIMGTKLTFQQLRHRISSRFSSMITLFKGHSFVEVKDLGITCDVKQSSFSFEISTKVEDPSEELLAAIILLHYSQIFTWRES